MNSATAVVLVPHAGEQPNPLIPVWAEIFLQLVLLAILVAVVVVVVRLVARRTRSGGDTVAYAGPDGLTSAQAYEAAYRFIADAARTGGSDATVSGLAASMQPVRDTYEGEQSPTRAAWTRALEETRRGQPLPRS